MFFQIINDIFPRSLPRCGNFLNEPTTFQYMQYNKMRNNQGKFVVFVGRLWPVKLVIGRYSTEDQKDVGPFTFSEP
jgi:hypothetical protein